MGAALGVWGGLAGLLAPQGKCRGLVFNFGLVLGGVGGCCLIAALLALWVGQPVGVWCGLLMGGVPALPFAGLLPALGGIYRQAEERRLVARDLI
jgi:hypothetical protein